MLYDTQPEAVAPSFLHYARAAFLAALIVFAIFPDVVLSRSSFRMIDQQWAVYFGAKPTNVYPVPDHLTWYTSGLNDPGGAEFQSEPMMEFMRYNFRTGNSPYWNPFSAAGSLGPETLIDLKFSIFTLAYAVLGGGAFVYDWLTLFGFWLGVFFIVRLCEGRLGLSWIAGSAAGIFYVLNGFSIANIGSNVAQVYMVVPWCLYASFTYVEKPSRAHFSLMVISFAALMSFTFLPTMLVGMLGIGICTAGFAMSLRDRTRPMETTIKPLIGFAGGASVAFLGLSFIYLPIVEHLVSTGNLLKYGDRVFFPASPEGLLSLFTPSHFFESYMSGASALPIVKNTIFHYGLIGLGLASLSFSHLSGRFRPLLIVAAACVTLVLGRAFNVYGITQVIERIPLIRNFGEQYIWIAATISLIFLVAIGTNNLVRGTYSRGPFFAVAAIAVVAATYLQVIYGLNEPNYYFKWTSLAMLVGFGLIFAIVSSPRYKIAPAARAIPIVGLMLVELIMYSKSVRFPAPDIFREPTSDVTFLQANAGLSRTMTFGAYATSFEAPSAFQFQEVTSLNFSPIESYVKYFNEMIHGLPASMRFGEFLSLSLPHAVQRLDYFDWRKVNLLGVRYIVQVSTSLDYLRQFAEKGYPVVHVSKFTTIVENKEAFPRAFLIDDAGERNAQIVIPPTIIAANASPVQIPKYRNAEVTLQGNAPRPSVVVLTDNWHQNWSAKLNGKTADIAVVEGTFRGVRVPAGAFTIEMSYAPRTLPIAILLSVLVGLTLLALLLERPARRAWGVFAKNR